MMVAGRKKLATSIPKELKAAVVLFFICVAAVSVAGFTGTGPQLYPEARELEGTTMTFGELAEYFKGIAEGKGASYAFEVLRVAPLPRNIDLHLMGHVVGDELYKQEGFEGIKRCTDEFRNACSHSVVVGGLLEYGESALRDIADVCRNAPGGKGAYTMCFHGLGHGVLAFKGYSFEQGVGLCKKTGTEEFRNQEYVECVGGMVMEMIAGVHDRVAWERQAEHYLNPEKPLSLCSAHFMEEPVQEICYIYLTPYLFQVAGADLGFPTPRDFEAAFRFCDAIPLTEERNRHACYSGFGKEFVVLAQDRDIRKIEDMNSEKLVRVAQWCDFAGEGKSVFACLGNALESLYWGGENDRDVAVRFCGLLDDTKENCFKKLIDMVSFYIEDREYRTEFCEDVYAPLRSLCTEKLL